jgi:hypothetical protein
MTDMQNSLVPEKSDLKPPYKTTNQKPHSDDIEEDNSLVPSIKKEPITIIKGIGPKAAERLNGIGITSIQQLAQLTPERIARIPGIGLTTAQKYVSNAIEHMKMKKLNDFSDIIQVVVSDEPTVNAVDNIEDAHIFENEDETLEYEECEYEELEEMGDIDNKNINVEQYESFSNLDDDIVEYEQSINEHTLHNEPIESLEPPERFTPETSSRPSPQIDILPETIQQPNVILDERKVISQEKLSQTQIKNILKRVSKDLSLSNFHIIEKDAEMRAIFTGIDMVAVKRVQTKEFLDLIYIIPIKVASLTGSLIVSSEDIEYGPSQTMEKVPLRLKYTPQSYVKALSQSYQAIQSDINNEGSFLKLLSKYFRLDITLEKSITGKTLFFRSGPLQYKMLVEPVLVSNNTVGFTDKIIPYAYQKNSNIHVVEAKKFTDLLQYLDQKYFLIETYSEKKNALQLDYDATNKFMKDLRKYSAPFLLYGFAVLIVLLSQAYFILPFMVNLGYGVVTLYIVVAGYLYMRLYHQKLEIHKDFAMPYYHVNLTLDESTLILINEEISPKLMDQFTYECIGKNSNSRFISKRETENAEKFLTDRVQKKKIEQSNLFEKEIFDEPRTKNNSFNPPKMSKPPVVRKKDATTEIKDKMINKYSKFLEE